METIEERARKYATKRTTPWDAPVIDYVAKEHYAIGATEQLEIDIDKACDWLEQVLYDEHINSGMTKSRLIEVFRKTMEK